MQVPVAVRLTAKFYTVFTLLAILLHKKLFNSALSADTEYVVHKKGALSKT